MYCHCARGVAHEYVYTCDVNSSPTLSGDFWKLWFYVILGLSRSKDLFDEKILLAVELSYKERVFSIWLLEKINTFFKHVHTIRCLRIITISALMTALLEIRMILAVKLWMRITSFVFLITSWTNFSIFDRQHCLAFFFEFLMFVTVFRICNFFFFLKAVIFCFRFFHLWSWQHCLTFFLNLLHHGF